MSKKGARNSRARNEVGWQDRMHNIDFSYSDEVEAQGWYDAVKPLWSACVEELVEDGWSVRITPPTQGDDYWVSCTGKSVENRYLDHSYIVRYPDLETAVVLMYYVITKWGEDGRLPGATDNSKGGWLNK